MCIIKQTEEVATFSKAVSIATAILLLVAVIFYAGLRYHTKTDYETLFYSVEKDSDEEVSFPAITLCPVSDAGPALNSVYWAARTFPNVDVPPKDDQPALVQYEYRGAIVTCLQYNGDIMNYNSANSPRSALVIRIGQDVTGLAPFQLTGAVGIIHDQGEKPTFEDSPMFYAPLGETVQVSVLNYYVRNTKREATGHFYVAVPALISSSSGASTNISQIIVAYNQFGYYVRSEYHIYTSWMWIGEVGGAAALLYFLQHAILWVTIGCARRTCFRKERKARKLAEAQDDPEGAHSNAAAVPVASSYSADDDGDSLPSSTSAATTTSTSTTSNRRRKRRAAPQAAQPDDSHDQESAAEMETIPSGGFSASASKPRQRASKHTTRGSEDRIVFDVGTLDDSE